MEGEQSILTRLTESEVEQGLSGPLKAKRLQCLEHLLQSESIDTEIVKISLDIENVPSNIQEYRERERHLENILRALRNVEATQSEKTQVFVFRYLLGSLYVNFEKFWGPTIRVIVDLLNQTKIQRTLLKVLLMHLKETNDIIYNDTIRAELNSPEDRPDHILHRNFLFQILSRFAHFVESNSVSFINEFFRFVQKELLVSPFIEKFTKEDLGKSQDEHEPMEIENDIEEEQERQPKTKQKRAFNKNPVDALVLHKRKSRETFITASKIIQLFSNMHKVHRQEEIKELMLELLCCRDSSVQKASFNCLLAFNQEHLRLYSDRILKIVNDKFVRTELTSFSLDAEESNHIREEDRDHLMPVILRTLFGKMIGKIGRKTSGRDRADHRKAIVMRFIAGCRPNEIMYFFALLFDPIFTYIDTPYGELEDKICKDIDINRFVPLNRLQAMLNSLSAYMDSVAHLNEKSLPHVLKLINIIVYFVIAPLNEPKLFVHLAPKKIDTLKSLKRSCINIVAEFFRVFEYYRFSQDEINFVFKHLIWTSTQGFVDKNHANSTPLWKLVEAFSSNRVFHPLLIKRNKADKDEYLLAHVINLYADSKTKRPILKQIASFLANIIDPDRRFKEESCEDINERQEEVPLLNDEDALIPIYDTSLYKVDGEISFSLEFLINFIPTIFERLKKNFQDFLIKKDLDHRVEKDELLVLTALSSFLKDTEQSLLGVRLLLSTLSHQRNGELILNTYKTILVLMKQVRKITDPSIVTLLADILGYQRNPEQRKELCNLIDSMAGVDSHLATASHVIQLMNATSDELMGLPDLVKWNEGFRLAFKFIDNLDEASLNRPEVVEGSFILLLHQTGFIINNVDKYEFSIRENCLIFYEKLARKINLIDANQNQALLRVLIDEILLDKFIKKGLRDTNETIKHTFIGILRSLAIHSAEKNKVLKEFSLFCNENVDLDLWEAIRHIQLHNRSKGLFRLVSGEEINQVSPKTLSSYFLPLAAGFLFSKTYKSVSSLADNAIKCIGIICRRLNWITYESTLSYYLALLTKANVTYQRTNIKLITEILKNFNFDLTSCKEAMEFEEENKKLEKRMKARHGTSDGASDLSAIATDAPSGKRLNPSTARMVYFSVTNKLIPKLSSYLHEMTRTEFEHDKNMANYMPEKDEIKRIPMAYAIVQLLNLLPSRYILFRDHLPTLFLKLSSFLKSKNEQVRKASRATLIKIMSFVGPAYMPDLLRVLKQNLDKGFQIHVLNYTIHSILDKVPLHYGCLDHSVHELVNSCFQEIFGKLAEDKEIAQILAKTFEAKKTKSYDTLFILASYISAEKLDYLMNSVKEVIKTSNDPRTVNKLSVCIQKMFNGLARNEQFPLDKMFNFIQSTIEESIPNLRVRQSVEQAERMDHKQNDSKAIVQREDRYLITKDLPRDRVKSKINEKGNSHMLVDNCLRLLHQTLEKNKVIIKRKEIHKRRLDGFVKLLSTCLKSSSPKCVMRALKCIHYIAQMKADLPSFNVKANSIVKKIFILLNHYNGVGMVHGESLEMIGMCFKTVALLLLRCEHVQLNQDQIRALLTYIEQDLNDTNRQATAFGTLHSLLERKCDSPELGEIMTKIADLLVTSSDESIRSMCIKTWQTYLLEYQHQRDMLQVHLTKFLRQLDYEFIDGRKSVLLMLNIVVTKFPEKILRNYFELMFYLLAQRVVNEESKEVRNIVGRLVALLIQRLPDQQSYIFTKFLIPWSTAPNNEIKILAIKLISIFSEANTSAFTKERMKKILPVVADALEVQEAPEKLTYHSVRLFKRLLDKGIVSCIEERYIDHLKKIWQNIASKQLSSSHYPTVTTSCEIYLTFIKSVDLLESMNVRSPSTDNYLDWNAKRIVRILCDKYIELLDKVDECNQLLNYVTESMILLGQVIVHSTATKKFEKEYIESFKGGDSLKHLLDMSEVPNDGFIPSHLPYEKSEAKKQVDLMWLSVKVVMQARKEAALYRLSKYYRREFVLRWSAAIAQELGSKRLGPYVFLFAMTPIRELTDKGKSKSTETLAMAEDLLKFIKGLIGLETFNKVYSKVQLHYTKKRVDRKKKEAIIRVKDQVRGVKRKRKVMEQSRALKRKRHLADKRINLI